MAKEKVTVKVDVHEDTSETQEVVPELAMHDEVEDYVLDALDYGDLVVEEADLMVERKTIGDYASSLLEGRLPKQIANMQGAADNVYVLVEGDLTETDSLSHTNMAGSSIRGHMASTMARKGVPVIPCSNTAMLVDMVVRLGRKYIEEPSSSHMDSGPVDTGRPVTERMYGCLSGVGPSTAEALHQEFSSMTALLTATDEEIESIDGIGSKRAGTIKEELRGG